MTGKLLIPLFLIATSANCWALRFGNAMEFPDLGLEMPILANARPDPIDLPKATSFIVSDDGRKTMEDRYDVLDLWTSKAVRGRWTDDKGNTLMISRLSFEVPDVAENTVKTRADYESSERPLAARKLDDKLIRAAASVIPANAKAPSVPRRAQRRHIKNLFYIASENERVLSWLFRPEGESQKDVRDWYVATLVISDNDTMDEAFRRFDEDFMDNVTPLGPTPPCHLDGTNDGELLVRDLRKSVVNYGKWHVTESKDVVVLDDINTHIGYDLISSVTNELPKLRSKFAEVMPSPLIATNQIAVVRIFANRGEYVKYVGEDYAWSAAIWSVTRRELVAFLPDGTVQNDLIETLRHESFHQYLDYASGLAQAGAFINEGTADMFAKVKFEKNGDVTFLKDDKAIEAIRLNIGTLETYAPILMSMGYDDFYSGSDARRQLNYAISWSMAYFLQVGAPEIRFQPFADVRKDYVRELVDSRSQSQALNKAFRDDLMKKFISAWVKYWKDFEG